MLVCVVADVVAILLTIEEEALIVDIRLLLQNQMDVVVNELYRNTELMTKIMHMARLNFEAFNRSESLLLSPSGLDKVFKSS